MKFLDFVKKIFFRKKNLKLEESNIEEINIDKSNKSELRKMVFFINEIISDPKVFDAYIESDERGNKTFSGMKINDIDKFIFDNDDKFIDELNLDENSIEFRRLEFIADVYAMKNDGYQINDNIKISEDFENSVMENVDKNTSKLNIALQIYESLCKNVIYDPTFVVLSPGENTEKVESIYNKDISNITLMDNKVVCKSWAELYAYFLKRNGINAFVCGSGKKHKNVGMIIDKSIVYADATNVTNSKKDNSCLDDITRIQMGFKPAGIKIFRFDGEEEKIFENKEIIPQKYFKEYSEYKKKIELREILKEINEERNLTNLVLEIEDDQTLNYIEKIKFINSMLEKNNLENIELVQYIRHLTSCIFSKKELENVQLSLNLSKKEEDDYKVVPLFSVQNNKENGKYLFFIYDEEKKKFEHYSKDEIIDFIIDEKYCRTHFAGDFKFVKGFEELNYKIDSLKRIRNEKRNGKNDNEEKGRME